MPFDIFFLMKRTISLWKCLAQKGCTQDTVKTNAGKKKNASKKSLQKLLVSLY